MHDELKIPAKTPGEAYERLLAVVRVLRRECPWDRVQDHHSLRVCMIEEAYEVAEAIDREDAENLDEELGDVLLQVAFHSLLAEEDNVFDPVQPVNDVCEKMIRRHPHVFSDEADKTVDSNVEKWENIKEREHGEMCMEERLAGVPSAFPALIRSTKIQKRATQGGYAWNDGFGSWEQVKKQTQELIGSDVTGGDAEQLVGDLLFFAAAAAVRSGVEPEQALARATERFIEKAVAQDRTKTAQSDR